MEYEYGQYWDVSGFDISGTAVKMTTNALRKYELDAEIKVASVLLFHPYDWKAIEELTQDYNIVYKVDKGKRERIVILRKKTE